MGSTIQGTDIIAAGNDRSMITEGAMVRLIRQITSLCELRYTLGYGWNEVWLTDPTLIPEGTEGLVVGLITKEGATQIVILFEIDRPELAVKSRFARVQLDQISISS